MTTYATIGLGPRFSQYTLVEPPSTWPQPSWPATVVTVDQVDKRAVCDLVKLAGQFGWSATITRAVGSWPGVAQRPTRQRESLAARLIRGTQRAVAVYVEGVSEGDTWAWSTLYCWTAGQALTKLPSIGVLQDVAFGPVHTLSWPTDWALPYFGPLHGPDKPKRKRK